MRDHIYRAYHMIKQLIPVLGAMVMLVTPAVAEPKGGEGRGRLAACRADIASHCRGLEAGGGRRIACLIENKAKLTPECAAVVEARAAAGSERRARAGGVEPSPPAGLGAGPVPADGTAGAPGVPAGERNPATAPVTRGKGAGKGGGRLGACRTDVATFCQGSEKGKERTLCLQQNEAKLSPECQAAFGQRVAKAQDLRTACKSDREAHCSGVERGGGRMLQCLRSQQAKLSAACSTALSTRPDRIKRDRKAEAAPTAPVR